MPQPYEIRADFDRDTFVVYQAYSSAIADPALKAQRFVPPFSFHRMTWIKPSFLWLMHRSNWGQKAGQERSVAIRISRGGWEKALSLGVLTHPEPSIYRHPGEWEEAFANAPVHVQWDTERSMRGAGLDHYSIQVGISRHLIQDFVDQWIVSISDLTSTVVKMRDLIRSGREAHARKLLPRERVYPTNSGEHLGLSS